MILKLQMLHPGRVAYVVEEGVEEWDRQMLMGVVYLECRIVVGLSVPEYPCCEESIEYRLDKRRPKEPRSLFVVDVEGES